MRIFSNEVLPIEAIDFTKWPTINGDSVLLETARSEYLDRCLTLLNHYMTCYSSHINYPIWEQYAETVEDILASRDYK